MAIGAPGIFLDKRATGAGSFRERLRRGDEAAYVITFTFASAILVILALLVF